MFYVRQKLKHKWEKISNLLLCKYHSIVEGSRFFKYRNQSYRYFIHEYNQTWKNERIVEIPIIKRIVDQYINSDILEVGNVLSHYFPFKHDVLDKYEKGENVINADAASFNFNKKYDLIISISTLEHIGWDEEKRDYKKILKAIDNLKAHLKKKGEIVFTHPLGYNFVLDTYIKKGRIKLKEKSLLKRISSSNRWKEIPWLKISEDFKYNTPFPYANSIVVGIIE